MSYRHRTAKGRGRVSRVSFLAIISLGPGGPAASSLQRLLSTSDLGEPSCKRSIRRLLQGGLPFSLRWHEAAGIGHCCSRGSPRADLDCRRRLRRLPGFHRAPWLMQLGLSSGAGPQRSPFPGSLRQTSTIRYLVSRVHVVPKGRFELPRVSPLRPERSASAVPPLRRITARDQVSGLSMSCAVEPTAGLEPATCCLRNSCSTN